MIHKDAQVIVTSTPFGIVSLAGEQNAAPIAASGDAAQIIQRSNRHMRVWSPQDLERSHAVVDSHSRTRNGRW